MAERGIVEVMRGAKRRSRGGAEELGIRKMGVTCNRPRSKGR